MDHSSLPPLDTLRAFEAAARGGSFSAAAQTLNLTHGAVSRQVAKLEHWLGVKVFDRQARGVALTPEGQRLYLRTNEAFALIADTSERWSEQRGSAVVRVASIPSVCGLWLMPRLKRFEAGRPSLRITLSVEHRYVDLADEGMDLAIRCGRGAIPDRVSLQLFEEYCFPIASPELAREIGTEGDAARLLEQTLIHDSDAAGWRAWFTAQGLDFRPRAHDRRFEDYNLVLDAAMSGLGIALARPPLAEALLKQGKLVSLDKRTALNPSSYWLDRPPGPMREAAQSLARRIGKEAGVSAGAIAQFIGTSS
ncbi:LysR substrate-binding domain-containing protein [Dongia sp.]|jgi:DNA-binding transcriptional LysR family regulator|uniref:LysR substrate-binding domain-containing protein n=1 Tax=Dongia sp. TaxID=1977262 RepID=UPI0035B226E9